MSSQAHDPELRAEGLLQDILGRENYTRLTGEGHLDLPSRLFPGRTYRLDRQGNLSYRDPGDRTFGTTLCIQPTEDVPRGDQVAIRYLLVTADEQRLVELANPISFGFFSLTRTLYHDFCQRHPAWLSALFTLSLLTLFLGAFAVEVWAAFYLLVREPVAAVALMVILVVPALVGLFIIAAMLADLYRIARRRLAARGA